MLNEQTPLEKAIDAAGSQSELARRIGVTQQTSSVWKHAKKGQVPADAAVSIERHTGVHRSVLRPDIFEAPGVNE